jgi:hypothetical protein
MENCCLNSYRICHPFVGCPTELIVKVPALYPETNIKVKITKANTTFETVVTIVTGYATVDLSNGPEAFINGFASMYELMLINPANNELVELQSSGDPVVSIVFTVTPGISNNTQFLITY